MIDNEDHVKMYPIMCDLECGVLIGWCDNQLLDVVIVCDDCIGAAA